MSCAGGTMNHAPVALPRRQFLGQVTLSFAGVALGSLAPVSLLQAAPAACLVDASAWPDACGDWQLDDMCNAYPPYAEPVRPAAVGVTPPAAHAAIDAHWVA